MTGIPESSGGGLATIVGTVTVDGSAVTQPVSAVALPLPAGAAEDATLTDGSLRVGGTVEVDGSGVVQPVSATALPLPDGAAAEGTLAAMASTLNEIAWQAFLTSEAALLA